MGTNQTIPIACTHSPVNDLSLGAFAKDIIYTTVITAIQAGGKRPHFRSLQMVRHIDRSCH